MRERYLTTYGSLQIQTLPYLVTMKLVALQSEGGQPKRAVTCLDLQTAFQHVVTPDEIARDIAELSGMGYGLIPDIDLRCAVADLPRIARVESQCIDLSPLVDTYVPKLLEAWASNDLFNIIGEFD